MESPYLFWIPSCIAKSSFFSEVIYGLLWFAPAMYVGYAVPYLIYPSFFLFASYMVIKYSILSVKHENKSIKSLAIYIMMIFCLITFSIIWGRNHNRIFLYLEDPNPYKRSNAIDKIKWGQVKRAVPKLIELSKNDPDEQVRKEALSVLTEMGPDSVAVPILIEKLQSIDFNDRRDAAFKLCGRKRKECIEPMIEIIDSGDAGWSELYLEYLMKFTGKNFGVFKLIRIPGKRDRFEDPERQKEIISRWKQWWKEEGDKFEFPK